MIKRSKYGFEQCAVYHESEVGMKVSIIGSGVVGQATGVGLACYNNDVLFNDIDDSKLASLKEKGYRVSSDLIETVSDSDAVFVCVPTPTNHDGIDLTCVNSCIDALAEVMHEARKYVVIAFRSTILPQTTRTVLIPALEARSGLKAGKDFGVCMNPEFLRESSPLDDFLNPSRVIIGEFDKRSGDVLENLYLPFGCPLIRTDLDSAEMIKYVSNLFLASKISFFNEFYMACRNLGLDAKSISEAASLDPRIGRYGIYGGRPFGGMCLPKDLAAFRVFAKSKGLSSKMLDAIDAVNREIEGFVSKDYE